MDIIQKLDGINVVLSNGAFIEKGFILRRRLFERRNLGIYIAKSIVTN